MVIMMVWIVLSVVVGSMANSRGRSGFLWFGWSLIISPLMCGLMVLCLRNIAAEKLAEIRHKELLMMTMAAASKESTADGTIKEIMVSPEHAMAIQQMIDERSTPAAVKVAKSLNDYILKKAQEL